jgi:hypothetical protein
MVFFKCVGCGARLQIGDEWASKLGNCCYCGVNSPVPGMNMPVPNHPKRSSRVGIIARMVAWPVTVLGFWASMFVIGGVGGMAIPFLAGGIGGLAGNLFVMWAFMNAIMWIMNPKEMRLWKQGGGDPFFDTVDPPFNCDPPEVRFQELYRERKRLEKEEGIKFD